MKKIFFAAIAACLFLAANAQSATQLKNNIKDLKSQEKQDKITLRKLNGSQVSYQSKQNFATDFKNATNVNWVRESYFDVASFTLAGKDTRAYYDIGGTLVGTITGASFAELPAIAQQQILKDYKDYTVEHVVFFDDNESNSTDMMLYNIQFADADNYFVELGKGTKEIVLEVSKKGDVNYFTNIL